MDLPVHRLRPLAVGPARGRLIVPELVVRETTASLRATRGTGGRHEGIVFWAGLAHASGVLISLAIAPDSDHGPGHVRVPECGVLRASRTARGCGLALLAQVHSHPGDDVRHSDGDDDLVLMPFEGMFSLVIARYGTVPIEPGSSVGLHQFQDGRWLRIQPIELAFIILPPLVRP